ncbi:HD-GYP domain-containing protein, partial [Salmonella enterica]|uniref:HD-GYP domain-containing protein n=1 Tax=Salmonella enterica TaxID=28901 RepID=UPI0039673A80
MQLAAEIALSHHERWDGTGYPQGLKGDAIPLSGRIVAVADVFDALTTRRPYKEAWSLERARDFLIDNAGRHFDAR